MLVKSFSDDLAWEVQRMLVITYFCFRQFVTNCTNFTSWGDPLIWWYQGSQNSTIWSVAHDYVYFGNRNNDQDGGLSHVYTSSVKDLKIGRIAAHPFFITVYLIGFRFMASCSLLYSTIVFSLVQMSSSFF